jgi:ankyrin repeat protein
MYGNPDVVKFLLDKGADPNVRDNRGTTPLLVSSRSISQLPLSAISQGMLEITGVFKAFKLLLDAGADVNAQDEIDGRTVLHILCTADTSQMAEWLLEKYKPKLDLRDNYNDTALHTAIEFQNKATETLLDVGLDINAIGNRGQTPLHAFLLRILVQDRSSLYNCLASDTNFWNISDNANNTHYFSPLQIDDSESFGYSYYPRWFENKDTINFGKGAQSIPMENNIESLLQRKPNVTLGKNEHLQKYF